MTRGPKRRGTVVSQPSRVTYLEAHGADWAILGVVGHGCLATYARLAATSRLGVQQPSRRVVACHDRHERPAIEHSLFVTRLAAPGVFIYVTHGTGERGTIDEPFRTNARWRSSRSSHCDIVQPTRCPRGQPRLSSWRGEHLARPDPGADSAKLDHDDHSWAGIEYQARGRWVVLLLVHRLQHVP